jgi:hypothetical protein
MVFTGVDIGDDDVWTESGMVARMGGVDVSVEVTPDGRGSSLWSTLFRPFCVTIVMLLATWFSSRSLEDFHSLLHAPPLFSLLTHVRYMSAVLSFVAV